MSLSAKLRRAPARIVTGAFILNAGWGKFHGDEATAKAVHGMASGAYPALDKVDPKLFLRAVAAGEVVLGGALLLPLVPAAVAGVALTGFAAGLLGIYWRTPSMHRGSDPRPTQAGTPIAKDVWMLGIGAGLAVDALTSRAHDARLEMSHQLREAAAVNSVKASAMTRAAKRASRRAVSRAQQAAQRS